MKIENFTTHRPVDRSDPGFAVPGFVLHWVSGLVTEHKPGRIWSVIKKSDCPKKLVDHLTEHNPTAFAEGETMRRGDLVLGIAPRHLVDREAKQKREDALEQRARVRTVNIKSPGGHQKGQVIEDEDSDVTEEMIQKFAESNRKNQGG